MTVKLANFVRVVVGVLLLSSLAQANNLLDTTGALTLGDPTQLGRLSRNGIVSDWSSAKAFPGWINTTTTYHYETFFVNVGVTPFIQITMDSLSPNTFAGAYLDSYDPTNPQATYLGDAGFSGNFFGTDPITFQLIVPAHDFLVVVINNTAPGNVGVGDPFHLIVQGYINTQFTSTPEPSTMSLLWSGSLVVFGAASRRLKCR